MPDEGVEELVAEGLGPGLAGEHCAEVRAALAHDLLEADHGGAFGGLSPCAWRRPRTR